VVFGSRVRGVPGAAMALIGLLGPPIVIVTGLGLLYSWYGEVDAIGRALSAVAAAAAGLLIATVTKMSAPIVRNLRDPAWVVTLAAFVAVGPMGWPLPIVFGVLAPVSLGLAWWVRR